MKKVKLYQNPLMSANAVTKADMLSEDVKPARVMGRNMMACAKMIGITPAEFTFNGKY